MNFFQILKNSAKSVKNEFSFEEFDKLKMFKFDQKTLKTFSFGSDFDIGGLSTANWEFKKYATFYGTTSTSIPKTCKAITCGYAGIKSNKLPFSFVKNQVFDVLPYRYFEYFVIIILEYDAEELTVIGLVNAY